MKFIMNNRIYEIKKVSQNELCESVGEKKEKGKNYFGQFHPYEQEIWLSPEDEVLAP